MKDLFYDTTEPVAALATPWGESALAVIRTTGDGCVEKFAGLFSSSRDVLDSKGFTMHFGYLSDPSSGERIDQITAAVYRARPEKLYRPGQCGNILSRKPSRNSGDFERSL